LFVHFELGIPARVQKTSILGVPGPDFFRRFAQQTGGPSKGPVVGAVRQRCNKRLKNVVLQAAEKVRQFGPEKLRRAVQDLESRGAPYGVCNGKALGSPDRDQVFATHRNPQKSTQGSFVPVSRGVNQPEVTIGVAGNCSFAQLAGNDLYALDIIKDLLNTGCSVAWPEMADMTWMLIQNCASRKFTALECRKMRDWFRSRCDNGLELRNQCCGGDSSVIKLTPR
jgi:hypothetical protein